MKKIALTVLFLILNLICFSQETSKDLIYTNVVKVDSLTKASQLFINAKSWFAENYKNSQNVIQFEDKEEGKIIGKGSFKYNSNVFVYSNGTKGNISYTITIYVKDGRYKYEISNFIHEGNLLNAGGQASFGLITTDEECPRDISTKGWRNKVWRDLKQQIDDYVNPLILSLNNYMLKSITKKEEKW